MPPKTAAYYRLMQEFRQLKRQPIEFIEAHPSEQTVLTWYFLIHGPPDSPYEGGEYLGSLVFPHDYPYNPPAISVHTPNGHFAAGPLCLTFSHFHPESWNPSWSVGTILLGLLSIMLENDPEAGSDDAQKRELAARSKAWNRKDQVYIAQFGDEFGW